MKYMQATHGVFDVREYVAGWFPSRVVLEVAAATEFQLFLSATDKTQNKKKTNERNRRR